MTARTAREVVELYNYRVYNEADLALADELIADTIVRHDVGSTTTLTREQAVERIAGFLDSVAGVRFSLPIVVDGQDGHVAIVYQADIDHRDGSTSGIASIEVFRVENGLITEVWNNSHQKGHWQ